MPGKNGDEDAPLDDATRPLVTGDAAPTEPIAQAPTTPIAQAPTTPIAQAPTPPIPPYAPSATQQPAAPYDPAAAQQPIAPYAPSAAQPAAPYDPNAAYAANPTQPADPAAPANSTESVGGAFPAMWAVCKLILSGRLVEAFKVGEAYKHYWHVALALFVFFGALIPAGAAGASLNGIASFFDSYGFRVFDSGDVFGVAVEIFFFGVVVFAAAVFCHIAAMYFTLKIRGVTVPFGRVASVWTVSATPTTFMLALSAILFIIPTVVTVFLGVLVFLVGVALTAYAANIANYVGVNRIAQVEKSMLVPFTLFNGLAAVVTVLIFFVVVQLVS
ncbi:hypothetical protein [Trueperella abortisuis]|uniref:Yip1 domain-containing protein n=1 Tax=Trueperella abortisuis TaxID=445930 RepID=A0ABT9PLA2_9ACTO|nr:hypothetical protein [Trueperella abortisuis]MDP9833174.1 hypothetical protein [Trueperella abortisuis]